MYRKMDKSVNGFLLSTENKQVSTIIIIYFQSIEDNPEFEYLKNILYEYMMGQQPLILVKVSTFDSTVQLMK